MKGSRVFHPFLFAIFPILFLFSHNIGELSLLEKNTTIVRLVIPIGITFCSTLVLGISLNILFKNKYKTGILISIFWLIFFSSGHLRPYFYYFYFDVVVKCLGYDIRFGLGNFWIDYYEIFLFIWLSCFILVAYLLRRSHRDLITLTHFLNIVAGILVLISLLNITFYEVKRTLSLRKRNLEYVERRSADGGAATIFPDIYYIILDEYAAASTLKEFYNYDNQPFLEHLTHKGFYLASKSRSNYVSTYLSLASSLNMEYVNYLSDQLGDKSRDLTPLFLMIKNSKVMRFLTSRGYKFIYVGASDTMIASNQYADWNVDCDKKITQDEFLEILLQGTMVYPYLSRFYVFDRYTLKRENILCQFSTLAQLHEIEGPIFVFAHILAPHGIYAFGPNGEEISEEDIKANKKEDLYLDQLIFINEKVRTLINEILLKSQEPPIVILQSDHGSRQTGKRRDAMRILNAYYLPQVDSSALLYESVTPVNTFRIIFNHYFETNYELLDDQSYDSNGDYPYQFINVTDEIKYH